MLHGELLHARTVLCLQSCAVLESGGSTVGSRRAPILLRKGDGIEPRRNCDAAFISEFNLVAGSARAGDHACRRMGIRSDATPSPTPSPSAEPCARSIQACTHHASASGQ